jgi:hypothetical protein
MPRFSNVVGFDDAPFPREHRGDVPVVGAVFAARRLDGVLCGAVRRDGANAARVLARLVTESRFAPQLQLVLLQGVAFAGFNVVDVPWLHRVTELPVLVVTRRAPRLERIQRALQPLRGGARKWRLIERLGAPQRLEGVFVQREGLSAADARSVIRRLAITGNIPEPIRVAHLIAGALARGHSRGRT